MLDSYISWNAHSPSPATLSFLMPALLWLFSLCPHPFWKNANTSQLSVTHRGISWKKLFLTRIKAYEMIIPSLRLCKSKCKSMEQTASQDLSPVLFTGDTQRLRITLAHGSSLNILSMSVFFLCLELPCEQEGLTFLLSLCLDLPLAKAWMPYGVWRDEFLLHFKTCLLLYILFEGNLSLGLTFLNDLKICHAPC